MMMTLALWYAIFLRAVPVGAAASLRWSPMFNNSMVLQRAPQRANVWGFGEPGANISVFLDGVKTGAATAQVMKPGHDRTFCSPIQLSCTIAWLL